MSFGIIVCGLAIGLLPADEPASPFARWEKAISAFEEQDEKSLPPKGAVLFVGSSSIRMWNVEKSFPDHTVINRGFGGSQIADSTHFADRIIVKHEPKTIVFYAGDNDIARGKTPERVAADFQSFANLIHQKLPKTKIVYIGVKPSIARWKLADTMQRANKLIKVLCEKDKRLVFVDVFPPMLGDDGKPRAELFIKDGLHLSEKGYAVWTEQVLPHLPKPKAAE